MTDYRLYFLNVSGAIKARVDLSCEADDEAIMTARGASDGRQMELWAGERFVMKFEVETCRDGRESDPQHRSE